MSLPKHAMRRELLVASLEEFEKMPHLSRKEARNLLLNFKHCYHDFLAQEVRESHISEDEYRSHHAEFAKLWENVECFLNNLPDDQLFCKVRERKRVLVLISEGGGGHKSAGDSLKEILSPHYDVTVINVLKDVLYPLDPLSVMTSKMVSGEDFYNFALRLCLHLMTSLYVRIGNWYMLSQKEKIDQLFSSYLEQQASLSAHLIISTLPVVNVGLITAARKLKIPFLMMPTDLHAGMFLNGFSDFNIEEDNLFKMALPYDDPDVWLKVIHSSSLKAKQIEITGFPVRRACLKKYSEEEIQQLRKKHGMLENHLTATLLAGAQGGEVIFEHAQSLAEVPLKNCIKPLECNICIGRNQKVGKAILDWLLSSGGRILWEEEDYTTCVSKQGVVLHIRGFTPEIIEVMACSQLLISKTGSCSVNEALYLGIPVLLDNTKGSSARHFWWERFNIGFIRKKNLGDYFTKSKQLKTLVPRFLKGCGSKTGFTPPDFAEKILTLVDEMTQQI